MNKLDSLKKHSIISADTSDIAVIKKYKPYDVTTNPSIILKMFAEKNNTTILKQAINYAKQHTKDTVKLIQIAHDELIALTVSKIANIIKGHISVEIDARLAFDIDKSINRANDIIKSCEKYSIGKDRVLIKLIATEHGIQAAKKLKKTGINCNLTLVLSLEQAILCAEAKVFLISPFVGRVLDWHIINSNKKHYTAEEDPGVILVKEIYKHYKKQKYKTQIMAASFRNTEEIEALSGCDKITIPPHLLESLSKSKGYVEKKLHTNIVSNDNCKNELYHDKFTNKHKKNAMAIDQLKAGIEKFINDQIMLENIIYNSIQ